LSQDDAALKAAIEDVSLVAGELRDLRQKIQHYGDASKRLDKLSDSLLKLSESVTAMQKDFTSILRKAELVQTHIEQGSNAVDTLVSGIPDVVSRIEATDTAKSTAEFTKLLGEVRNLMLAQQSTTQGMQAVIDGFSDLSGELKSITDSTNQQAQLLQLVNQVLMQNVAGPVNENARLLGDLKADVHEVSVGANKATEGMASLSIKLMKEIESMRKEIVTLRGNVSSSNKTLKEQSDRIDTLSKKKGLLF
jgi:methyl-accepting chemotaxis protein